MAEREGRGREALELADLIEAIAGHDVDEQGVERASDWLKAHDAEVGAAARATLLSEAMKYSNKRATPSGPFVWSVTLGELEQIINRANGAPDDPR